MTHGSMNVDFEVRVDYDRLRRERLAKAKKALGNSGLGALVCFDPNNTRYVTSTYLGEWARDKMGRYAVLPLGGEPILYDFGSAVKVKQMRSPWLKPENVRPTTNWMRGSVPLSAGIMDDFAREFASVLDEHGVRNKPIGVDIMDVPLLKAMQSVGIQIEDGQQVMLDARQVKTADEIELLKMAAGMADAAFADLCDAIRPGIRENELQAIASDSLHRLGSDQIEYVNVASGERTNPHPHTTTDRMIRPGDLVYIDLMHSFNGYRTCYYRTFMCGEPTPEQIRVYNQTIAWLDAGIEQVKPGSTTADIAAAWPTAQELGFADEAAAFALQFGHGIGLSIWERPVVSRLFSLKDPFPLEVGNVFALETYCGTPDGSFGARVEDEVVVTPNGHEVITKFPRNELPVTWS